MHELFVLLHFHDDQYCFHFSPTMVMHVDGQNL